MKKPDQKPVVDDHIEDDDDLYFSPPTDVEISEGSEEIIESISGTCRSNRQGRLYLTKGKYDGRDIWTMDLIPECDAENCVAKDRCHIKDRDPSRPCVLVRRYVTYITPRLIARYSELDDIDFSRMGLSLIPQVILQLRLNVAIGAAPLTVSGGKTSNPLIKTRNDTDRAISRLFAEFDQKVYRVRAEKNKPRLVNSPAENRAKLIETVSGNQDE